MEALNIEGFETLKLSTNVLEAIKRKGYVVPRPIQRETIPLILAGYDIVAEDDIGYGKTTAFFIPMLHKLNHHWSCGVRALVVTPTRVLALETFNFIMELGCFTGDTKESQFETLSLEPDIIIATPEKLMHYLADTNSNTNTSLRTVEYVVFDEASTLYTAGFAEQLPGILSQLSENRQTLIFSETLPRPLLDFAKATLRGPLLIPLRAELSYKSISIVSTMTFLTLRQEDKYAALLYLVREVINRNEQTLIYVDSKQKVEILKVLFDLMGIQSSICKGCMDWETRNLNLSNFIARKCMLLIVTDISVRGVDTPATLQNIINFDFLQSPKSFVHRACRVGRLDRAGTVYLFVTSEDMTQLFYVHQSLEKPIRPAPTAEEIRNELDSDINENIYGRFPQTVLDVVQDEIRQVVESSSDIAYDFYTKTKPIPSDESIRRAIDLPLEGLHPLFTNLVV